MTSTFDYIGYTCPSNKKITDGAIEDILYLLNDDAIASYTHSYWREKIAGIVNDLHDDIQANSATKIREAFATYIDESEYKISALEVRVQRLEAQVEKLQSRIDELQLEVKACIESN